MTLPLSSLPGIPSAALPALKGDCQDSGDSSPNEWEMGAPGGATWAQGAKVPGRAECFKSLRASAI